MMDLRLFSGMKLRTKFDTINTVAQTETPEPIRKGKGYSPLACDAEEIKKNLSWKRLLIALLES